jgi:sigma-B regulation protein RsbU (phosphoserine phosphatase)
MAGSLADRLASLYRMGQVINSSLVLDEVLDLVLDNLIELMSAERGAILLFDQDGELSLRVARDSSRQPVSAEVFRTSQSILREVARTGVPRIINDASSEQGYQAFGSVFIHRLRSILCAPLTVRQRPRGVLYVDNRLRAAAFTEDDLDLLTAFADQAAVAIENARLYEELGQRERLRRELEIARAIQKSLMPRELPRLSGFQLAATCSPACDVGGDFYDVMTTDGGDIVVYLGDVSGKGVPAALLMGMVRTLLRSEALRSQSMVDAVQHCNRVLYEDFTNTNMFATLTVAMLEPASRTLRYLNCGHCESLLWRASTRTMERLTGDGLPLGILEDLELSEQIVHLEPGDVVITYSDGFSEARSITGELLGVERLCEALRASAHWDAEGILEYIEGVTERFAQGAAQSDDQTIVVLRAKD